MTVNVSTIFNVNLVSDDSSILFDKLTDGVIYDGKLENVGKCTRRISFNTNRGMMIFDIRQMSLQQFSCGITCRDVDVDVLFIQNHNADFEYVSVLPGKTITKSLFDEVLIHHTNHVLSIIDVITLDQNLKKHSQKDINNLTKHNISYHYHSLSDDSMKKFYIVPFLDIAKKLLNDDKITFI